MERGLNTVKLARIPALRRLCQLFSILSLSKPSSCSTHPKHLPKPTKHVCFQIGLKVSQEPKTRRYASCICRSGVLMFSRHASSQESQDRRGPSGIAGRDRQCLRVDASSRPRYSSGLHEDGSILTSS